MLRSQLPDNPQETKLTVSQRFQNVVGILNEINKFNRQVSVNSEVRTLADGSVVEVASLYIGIGQALYTSANETVAGTGMANEEKWVWKPNNQAARKIAEAIAILKNEKVASFVQVPVEIK